MTIDTIIGVDLAKNVFQLHGTTVEGPILFRKKLSRPQFHRFMSDLPAATVVMEACGGANYWARELEGLGHHVKLISPQYVKPFVKRQKMGWLPPSPDGIAMCQGCGVQRHKKERTANERYNDRSGPGKKRFPTSRRHDVGASEVSQEADPDAVLTVHVDSAAQCGRDGGVR